MSGLEIHPCGSAPSGTLRVASDKSITQRAMLLSAAATGRSVIEAPLDAADTRAVRQAMQALGARVEVEPGRWIIDGVAGRWPSSDAAAPAELDLMNSGTGARLLLGLLGGQGVCARITGDESLRRRPMRRVTECLERMGVHCQGPHADRLPLRVSSQPPLRPFEGSLELASAQVKSAILFAALGAQGRSQVEEPAPSRDHTERMLPQFGVPVETRAQAASLLGPARLTAATIRVPADPSSAAFFAALAALHPGSCLRFPDLLHNPRRTRFFDMLERMGAQVQWTDLAPRCGETVGTCTVIGRSLAGVDIEPQDVPALIDELPILAVLAAYANGVTRVRGAAELRVKESDRIAAVEAGLRAMGGSIESLPDGFVVRGRPKLRGTRVRTELDHRIAMAFTIAALNAEGPTVLDDADCIAVSYPGFLEDLAGCLPTTAFRSTREQH